MEKKEINFGFLYYFKVFWSKFIISLKEQLEFKANFFSAIAIEIFDSLALVLFGFVLIKNFGNIIDFTIIDFLLMILFAHIILDSAGILWYDKTLSYYIKQGNLNNLLFRPGKTILNYVTDIKFNSGVFVFIQTCIYFPIILFFSNWTISSIIISILIILFLIIVEISIIMFFISLSWYFLELGDSIVEFIFINIYNVGKSYPFQYFQNSILYFLFAALPIYFVSTLLVPIFQNKHVGDLTIQIIILLSVFICSLIGTYFNWKYGLKKYEAFG